MPDDRVPEEEEQAYSHLLTALRSAAQQREPITATEQTEMLTRVRERLAGAASASTVPNGRAFTPRRQFLPGLPTQPPNIPTRWTGRLLVALGALVLILVSSWALFKAAPAPHSPNGIVVQPPATKPAPTAQTQFDDLEASMQVLIDGPYFLSELLPVDVSLTNHRQQSVMLFGISTTANQCLDSALMVKITAGSDPGFVFPKLDAACDLVFRTTQVQPGKTLTIHQYIPLTRSGLVTLTMQSGREQTPAPPDPLDGHWPSVQIQVFSRVPQNRALALGFLQSMPEQVIIQTPAGTQPHLLYMQTITCENYVDSRDVQWTPLSTNILHQPACPAAHPHWKFIVSAPGYAIVSGEQQA